MRVDFFQDCVLHSLKRVQQDLVDAMFSKNENGSGSLWSYARDLSHLLFTIKAILSESSAKYGDEKFRNQMACIRKIEKDVTAAALNKQDGLSETSTRKGLFPPLPITTAVYATMTVVETTIALIRSNG